MYMLMSGLRLSDQNKETTYLLIETLIQCAEWFEFVFQRVLETLPRLKIGAFKLSRRHLQSMSDMVPSRCSA